jgi:acyl-homoserine lactone acylase PvdQ
MNRLKLSLAIAGLAAASHTAAAQDAARWERQAQGITIVRDDWGIAHVHGKTDADAVFGMIYAQAEDDFNRVETNYLNSMGRLAEAEGQSAVFQDLRIKLFIDPDSMKAQYATSPDWLKTLMNAWADGLNFYLYKHPAVKPRVIAHFEPWMALTFSDGSIGPDYERVNLRSLEVFYGKPAMRPTDGKPSEPGIDADAGEYSEPTGSNGIAIAPSNTASHHALLWINPHTSFFFRSELQMTSDEGLNAYGAVTWGQFFIYQGFNDRTGWMHTSTGADFLDEYLETVIQKGDTYYYKYGNEERPMIVSTITVPYKTDAGMATKQFTIYRTHHGPVTHELNGKWVTMRLMQEPVKALIQSYSRIKTKSYKEFAQTMELHTNSSNNTIYADADGNIAYFHANFIPRRDPRFDWTKPVDGSDPTTEWNGLLSVNETPKLFNPASGWLYNSNNWPWSAAGPSSPKREDFPKYVETGTAESPRGKHALIVLPNKKDFTPQSLIDAAYDSYLPSFAETIPALIAGYDSTPDSNPVKAKVAEQIAVLRGWDYRWGVNSIPTSLAVFWATGAGGSGGGGRRGGGAATASAAERLQSLANASDKLTADFGTWKTPWGEINRFQRLTGDIVQPFNDAGPSIPVGFTSSQFGSLASFGARAYPGTKKWYGTSGNSFIAVVEFGDSVRARAVSAGGENGDPSSKHFNDQATRYSKGDLRAVYFYPGQLKGHTDREYHPGG